MNKLTPLFLLIAAAIFYLCWVAVRPAEAHDWYMGTGCCYGAGVGKDCDNISSANVRAVDGGWIVTLTRADMLRIRPNLSTSIEFIGVDGISEFFPQREAKKAQDGEYSACLKFMPTETLIPKAKTWLLCFFHFSGA